MTHTYANAPSSFTKTYPSLTNFMGQNRPSKQSGHFRASSQKMNVGIENHCLQYNLKFSEYCEIEIV